MILYHVITTGHLLCAMTKQLLSAEDAILVVPRHIKEKFPQLFSLSNIFEEIILYEANYRFLHSKDDTSNYIQTLLPDLNNYSEIYVWGAQFSLGVYLAEQQIPFIYCEEAVGMLSRHTILEHIDKISPLKSELYPYIKELGLYTGDCQSAKYIMCNMAAQLENFKHDNIYDFRVIDELASLSEEKRQIIISFFTDITKINVPKKSTILFTQHLANLRLTSFEEQALLYQLLVDYFFENEPLVIKPHPDDLMHYSQLFPKAKVIRERFPSEFLPFLLDNKPKCIATIYSTAIYNLRGYYSEIFELDQSYEKDFYKIHRYFVSLQIAKEIGYPISCIGTNQVLISKLAEQMDVDIDLYNDISELEAKHFYSILIIDEFAEEKRNYLQRLLKNNEINFLFVNSKNDYCWYDIESKNLWDDTFPIVINKAPRDDMSEESFYENLEEEIMYMYTKNQNMKERIKYMDIEKQLPHTGIKISKLPLNNDEERIKVLEGMLEATEKRLLYYMEKSKEIEKNNK